MLCPVTGSAGASTHPREALRARLRDVLVGRGINQSALARQLTEKAAREGLAKGDRPVHYDPGMVSRWAEGRIVISRQGVWLLDLLYPPEGDQESFQDLRDRYVLANDRAQVPDAEGFSDLTLLRGARCSAHLLGQSQPRFPLPLGEDEKLVWLLLSVVDCGESRQVVQQVVDASGAARIVAMYDLMGRWDLAVKLAVPADSDHASLESAIHDQLVANEMAGAEDEPDREVREFTGQRTLVTDAGRIRGRGDTPTPTFLVLGSNEEYELYRIQRAFIFVEMDTLPDIRRSIAMSHLAAVVADDQDPCTRIVEAVTTADDCLILELVLTCADEPGRLNQLNRLISPVLTRYKLQKYNLLVYSAHGREWNSRAG